MNNTDLARTVARVRFPVLIMVGVCLVLDAFIAVVSTAETDVVAVACTPLAAIVPFLVPLGGTVMARMTAATRARQSLPPLRPGSMTAQALAPLAGLPEATIVALVTWTRYPAIAAFAASALAALIWWPRASRLSRLESGELAPMFAGVAAPTGSQA